MLAEDPSDRIFQELPNQRLVIYIIPQNTLDQPSLLRVQLLLQLLDLLELRGDGVFEDILLQLHRLDLGNKLFSSSIP